MQMTTASTPRSVALRAAAMASFLCTALSALAAVPPCTTSTAQCTERIAIEGEQQVLQIYRSYSLALTNKDIRRAFVLVHGINRDADNHFRTALAAAFLAGALNDTVVVAPRFASSSRVQGNEAGHCSDN